MVQEENGAYIETLDSTLRDGAQGEGINFSVADKIHIAQALDALGVTYIEAGNPGSNPKDAQFFKEAAKLGLKTSRLCAFGSTRRKDTACKEDAALQSLLAAQTEDVVIFGKTWKMQVTDILRTSEEENLDMIQETCAYLAEHGRRVIFDAEHFFTGYKDDAKYALKTLQAAIAGGAKTLALCETKGGELMWEVEEAVSAAVECARENAIVGIHTHDDSGLAAANSLAAVRAGASHVQGTLLGFGERTGNANLATIIADLEIKMGARCLPDGNLARLTSVARNISEIANIALSPSAPYVGSHAFAHKAGMHIDAVLKRPDAYEHISPDEVGNSRVFLMSEVAGRSMVIEKVKHFVPGVTKDSQEVKLVMSKVKTLEQEGYQFEGADGSFELLVRRTLGKYRPFFNLHYYQTNGINPRPQEGVNACAQVKLDVDGQVAVTAADGDGPVNALDRALRQALSRFYPSVDKVRLTDYKVRVIDGVSATAAKVRVLIESTDGKLSWSTVGVSSDIMEASYLALVDSIEYCLIRGIERYIV